MAQPMSGELEGMMPLFTVRVMVEQLYRVEAADRGDAHAQVCDLEAVKPYRTESWVDGIAVEGGGYRVLMCDRGEWMLWSHDIYTEAEAEEFAKEVRDNCDGADIVSVNGLWSRDGGVLLR